MKKTRRYLLRLLSGSSAAIATTWLLPEAKGFTRNLVRRVRKDDPNFDNPPDDWAVTNLSPSRAAELVATAVQNRDVSALIALAPIANPTVPILANRLEGVGANGDQVLIESISVPYVSVTSPHVTAVVVFNLLTLISGAYAGQQIVMPSAIFPNGSVYVAAQQQVARYYDPEEEARLFNFYFGDEPGFQLMKYRPPSKRFRFWRVALDESWCPWRLDGKPRDGDIDPPDRPIFTDCERHCYSCAAFPPLTVVCGIAVLAALAVIVIVTITGGAGLPIVAGIVGATALCLNALGWYLACIRCRRLCIADNTAKCQWWVGRHPEWPGGGGT